MPKEPKTHAEIAGKDWQVAYPFCAGCEHLTFGYGMECGHAGNGCAYPEARTKLPVSFQAAFFAMANTRGGAEALAKELGPCTEE